VVVGHQAITFNSVEVGLGKILESFLQGDGVPCQESLTLAISQGLVNSSINLSGIDLPSFRPQMFHMAATGSDSVQFGEWLQVGAQLVCSYTA